MEEGTSAGRGRVQSYTLAFKLEVLEKLSELRGNISDTARFFSIPRPCVQDWMKQQEKLNACKAEKDVAIRKRRNVPSTEETAKKRAKYPAMEEELAAWIAEERKQGMPVSASCIKLRAEQLLTETSSGTDFKASNGWLGRFVHRYSIVNRTVTSVGQKVPENADLLCQSFYSYHNSAISEIELGNIGNMDETPMWFDLPHSKTYDFKGVKHVICKTTGKEKLRYNVVLSAMADGRKLKPMIIFKGLKNVPKVDFPKDVVVSVAMKGSMTAELMNCYKQKVWGV